jgi:hypothetical protein
LALALLPRDFLNGLRLGISVSNSPDLERLGLLDTHLRLALAEIARCILVSGGTLAYGGHLEPEGYTTFLVKEIQKYGRQEGDEFRRMLLVCLAWPEHRRVALSKLAKDWDLGLRGHVVYLDPDGKEIDPDFQRAEEPQPVSDPGVKQTSLTAMRRYMGTKTAGRVLLGGKRHDFQGEIPGLMEEALIALEARQPLYLAGGFGGATADIAAALGIDGGASTERYDRLPPDPRWEKGREALTVLAASPGWVGLNNGLTEDENRRLAATYRPSDIAALVSLGLGRWHA